MNIAVLTNIIPSYRVGFYDNLFKDKEHTISIYCQEVPKAKEGFKSLHDKYKPALTESKFISIANDKLIWHLFPFIEIFRKHDVLVVDGNPRHLSLAIFSTFARLLGKKVVIWSVCYSRNNNFLFGKLRLKWWKIFEYFLMYNPCDVKNMKIEGFDNKTLVSINNGLNQTDIDTAQAQWTESKLRTFQAENDLIGKKLAISIGRLVNGRFDLMVDAIELLKKDMPNILWVVIGSGEGETKLKKAVKEKNLEQNIRFTGAIYEEENIAPWMMSASIYVHPAPIGLSIFHAFGYGLPVITTDRVAFQGPEFCAFEEAKTGEVYLDGDAQSLMEKCKHWLNTTTIDKPYIKSIPLTGYNTDVMHRQFMKLMKLSRN